MKAFATHVGPTLQCMWMVGMLDNGGVTPDIAIANCLLKLPKQILERCITQMQQYCNKMQLILNFAQITRTNTGTDVLYGWIKMRQIIFPGLILQLTILCSNRL